MMYVTTGKFVGYRYRMRINGEDDPEEPTILVEYINGRFIDGAIFPIKEGQYDLGKKSVVDIVAEMVLEEAFVAEIEGMTDCDYTLIDWRSTRHPELYFPENIELLNEFFRRNIGFKPYETVEIIKNVNQYILRTFDSENRISTSNEQGEQIELRIADAIKLLKKCRPEFGNKEQIAAINYLESNDVTNYLMNFWDYRTLLHQRL